MLETRSFDHMLGITYLEHDGCYDHVAPPTNAVPPDDDAGEFGFDIKRFGLRVPTVLVSPLIPAGTVFRGAGELTIRYKALQCPLHQGADGGLESLTKEMNCELTPPCDVDVIRA
jgi:hypothetical protein